MATGNDVKFRVSVDTGTAPQDLNGLGQAVDRVTKETDGMAASGVKAADSTDKLGASANAAGGLIKNLGATIAAGFTFEQLVTAAAQFESVKAGLQAVSGSAEQAGAQMDFVRAVANRTGADITEVGRAFLGLTAATKGTAVEGEPTRQVFEAVAAAMGKAGKSSAETQNALVALAQIASKGTVSMEELRGQLGEALPGALQATANGLGVTTQDLIKLVEQGQIAAEDLFPALSKGLADLYGGGTVGAQTLAQEITNIKNAFTELAADLGEAGGLDALKVGAEIAQTALVLLNDALITTGKTVGTLAGAVATMDFSGLTDAFATIEQESRDKLLKAAQHNQTLATYIAATGNEATKAALAQQQAGTATQAAGEKAAGAAAGYIALGSAYGKVAAEIDRQIAATEKSNAARDAEVRLVVDTAAAFGTEAEKRAAAAEAAAVAAEGLVREAELRTTALNVAKAELDAKQFLIDQSGVESEQRKKEIEALTKEIEVRQAAADKANAQAASAKIVAEAAAIEVQKHQDNTARLGELATAYAAARAKVEELTAAKAAGRATDEQAKAAQLELAKAAALYRDALTDQEKSIRAKADALRASNDLEQASVRVGLENWKAILEVAKARGDEATVARAQNEIRKLEIELLRLKAQALRAEADAQIAAAKAERARLELSGQLTEADRLRIDAAIKKAEVMRKEADIADITASKLGQLSEINNTLSGASRNAAGAIDGTTAALYRQNDALEANIAAQEKANELKQRAIDLENKRRNVDSEGFSLNTAGERVQMVAHTTESLTNALKDRGVSDAMARAQAEELKRQFDTWARGTSSGLSGGSFSDSSPNFDSPLTRSFDEQINRVASAAGVGGAGSTQQQASTGTPVNITINGARQTVNVANQTDAAALQRILQQLANDSGRA